MAKYPRMLQNVPKILVADGDSLLCDVLRSFLERKHYQVVVVCDGAETLQKLQQENPEAVLLDAYMLRKDGLEILREIR